MNDVLIFILDDDMDEAEQIGMLLHENGFTNYKIFTTSISLLTNMNTQARIFIIDYKIDKLNGLEVIEKIREVLPHCYFIMLSGMKSYSVIEKFNNAVMRGIYITKGELDTNSRIIKFIKEFLEDMRLMEGYYKHKNEIENSIKDIKKIINGNTTNNP